MANSITYLHIHIMNLFIRTHRCSTIWQSWRADESCTQSLQFAARVPCRVRSISPGGRRESPARYPVAAATATTALNAGPAACASRLSTRDMFVKAWCPAVITGTRTGPRTCRWQSMKGSMHCRKCIATGCVRHRNNARHGLCPTRPGSGLAGARQCRTLHAATSGTLNLGTLEVTRPGRRRADAGARRRRALARAPGCGALAPAAARPGPPPPPAAAACPPRPARKFSGLRV